MIPLTIRSHYSALGSVIRLGPLAEQATRMGYAAVGLTDRDTLCGLWPFLAHCRRAGIRPLVGAEITVRQGRLFCLVKDQQGYGNLCRLLTSRFQPRGCRLDHLPREWHQGLIWLTTSGERLRRWREQERDVAAALLERPCAAGRRLRQLARQLQVPAVALPDVRVLHPDDTVLYRLVRSLARKSGDFFQDNTPGRLVSPAEYGRRFAVWPDALRATHLLAEKCDFQGPDFGLVLPPFHTLDPERASRLLRHRSFAGARRRYGVPLPTAVRQRLEHELRIIDQMRFATYFLTVHEIVKPVSRTCGRGSGAASLVAYCLRITNVCPLTHNLYFERFLHPQRQDAPDIDIDFAWDERDQVLATLLGRYPRQAAMVSNQVRLQPRLAVRATARAFGLPDAEISRMLARLSRFHRRGHLPDQAIGHPLPNLTPPWSRILALAHRMTGLLHHLSLHVGGVVITPRTLATYVPVQPSRQGRPMVQWDKDGVERAGLVKIDLLGNRSLAVIRDTLAQIRPHGPEEDTWRPENDPATRATLAQGRTMGCFYIESPAMRLLQQRAGRGDFEHLVIHSSIIRPAANEYIREYLRRLHSGITPSLHPKIDDLLAETLGIMVYQEDVARVAVRLGFCHGAADRLRKIIAKKDNQHRLADFEEQFMARAAACGLDKATADTIWQMMASFAGYSFCKPHSASYAQVSLQAAWLKTHYPAPFMAAVLSNGGGYYSTFAYVSEARRLGLRIRPPDVQRSDRCWQGKDRNLRVGLAAIHYLQGETIDRILTQRRRHPFAGPLDFLQRVCPGEDEARALIHAGALDSLLPPVSCRRGSLHFFLAWWLRHRRPPSPSLFAPEPAVPHLPPDDPVEQMRQEYRILGFCCASHPLTLLDHYRQKLRTVLVRQIPRYAGGPIIRVLGWLLSGKVVRDRQGNPMEFITFEDATGLVECTFFPAVYRRYRHLLLHQGPLLLAGRVEQEFGVCTLTVTRVEQVASLARQSRGSADLSSSPCQPQDVCLAG